MSTTDMYPILQRLVPDNLTSDEEYNVLLKLFGILAGDITNLLDKFPDLADLDNCPEIFLPKLSALLNYEYKAEVPADIQRLVISRIVHVYKNRGSEESIIQAATHGSDPKWVGHDVFLPDYTISHDKATLDYPMTHLFRHSISSFSGPDRYADGSFYRDGVLVINLPYFDDKVRKEIAKVVPAGVKIYFNLAESMGDDETSGTVYISFGEWTLYNEYLLDITPFITDDRDAAIFSAPSEGKPLLSGRQNLFILNTVDVRKSVTFIPQSALEELFPDGLPTDTGTDIELPTDLAYNTNPPDLLKEYSGLPIRSDGRSDRSQRYAMSGLRTQIIEGYASFDNQPVRISPLYTASRFEDMTLADVGLSNLDTVQVDLFTRP